MSYLVKFTNAVRCLPVVYLLHQRLTRTGVLGSVIALVLNGAVLWKVRAKACSLVLYDMQNRSISARESIADLATSTLEGKPMLWVIASGATATKCRRRWKPGIVELVMSSKEYSFLL